MAHHFTQAGFSALAVEWWGRAGDLAMRRSAYAEALAHLEMAIKLADDLEDGPEQGFNARGVGWWLSPSRLHTDLSRPSLGPPRTLNRPRNCES